MRLKLGVVCSGEQGHEDSLEGLYHFFLLAVCFLTMPWAQE